MLQCLPRVCYNKNNKILVCGDEAHPKSTRQSLEFTIINAALCSPRTRTRIIVLAHFMNERQAADPLMTGLVCNLQLLS